MNDRGDRMSYELWVEKYRPRKLDDMVDQEEVVEALKGFVKSGSIPHLLFAGPPGTGKTTAALALANEIYGQEDLVQANYLELNASDERGIETIRTKIKDFAKTAPAGGAPYKIIHLDEADHLTPQAQHALRRIMEMYSSSTRFILACNYSSRIIEPIQSRTAVFRFLPLPESAIKDRLRYIAEKEGVVVSDGGLDAIVYVSEGDLRRAINTLQTVSVVGKEIDKDLVFKMAGLARPEKVERMIKAAYKGNFLEARELLRELMLEDGVSGEDLIKQIYREISTSDEFSDPEKAKLISYIGEVDFRLALGLHPDVQLGFLLAQILELGSTG